MFYPDAFLPALLATISAYLVGSLSAAIIVCRLMNLPDPRSEGSGNPGATNVLRVGGRLSAALTLAGDGLKAYLPVLLVSLLTPQSAVVAMAALGALVGHLYPVFFGFRGGKGVATAFGALLAISPSTGLLALLTWLAIALALKRSSLAALATFVLVPLYLYVAGKESYVMPFIVIGALLFYTHRSNVQRLLAGTEPKIGDNR